MKDISDRKFVSLIIKRIILFMSLSFILGSCGKEEIDLTQFDLTNIKEVVRAMKNMEESDRVKLFNRLEGDQYSYYGDPDGDDMGHFWKFSDGFKTVLFKQSNKIKCVVRDEHRIHVLRYNLDKSFKCGGSLIKFKEGRSGKYYVYILYNPTDEQIEYVQTLPDPKNFTENDAIKLSYELEKMTSVKKEIFWEEYKNANLIASVQGSVREVKTDFVIFPSTGIPGGSIYFHNTSIICHVDRAFSFILYELDIGSNFTCAGKIEKSLLSNEIYQVEFDPYIGVAK